MKKYSSMLAVGLFLPLLSFSAHSSTGVIYSITMQDASGVETTTLPIQNDDRIQRVEMMAGTVEILPPSPENKNTLLKLYIQKEGKPLLAHTAEISGQQAIDVAYSLCNGKVTYYSPKPDQLATCGKNLAR